ncbi:MAG: hypothetical protein L0K86_00330 [Actinomycetia bacterium]|nr:hypothetical protein [Actinomycetes bacterium]
MVLARTAGGAMALMLILAACWGGGAETPTESRDRSTGDARSDPVQRPEEMYPDVVRRVRFSDADLLELPRLSSSLPGQVQYPPTGEVTSLIEDPPGRAVMSIVNAGGRSAVSDLGSYTWYLYGVDGRWRVFDLGELGLPDSEWADWNVAGDLSQDGRYAALRIDSALLIFDMASGDVRRVEPKRGLTFGGGGKWTPDGLVAMGYSGKDAPAGVFIDPATGRQRPWRGPSLYRTGGMSYDWDGTPVLEWWAKGRVLGVKGYRFFDRRGRVVRRLALPWELSGRSSAALGEHGIAFYREAAHSKRLRQPGAFIVTDRRARPEQIVLTGNDEGFAPWIGGWLDEETVLAETSRVLVAWRPDEEKFYRLTRLVQEPEMFYYSIATDLVQPKPSD